ncbi:hypothetical protein H2203_001876 [Taxawa tesnikishii (nom. ined.)]|nr:hypothetical protein H2203_001876 [Dothideales sp. JES 119]
MRFVHPEAEPPKESKPSVLRVACVGLPRCATSSMQLAMQQLGHGLGPTFHMSSIMPYADRMELTTRATNLAATDDSNKEERQALVRQLVQGYHSTSDAPAIFFVEDFIEMYPGIKLVLNKHTVGWMFTHAYTILGYPLRTDYVITRKYRPAWEAYFGRRYGTGKPMLSPDLFDPEIYHKHNDLIRRLAKEKGVDLLEFTPDMGWEPLCRFLNVPIPDVPFPHTNDTRLFQAMVAFLLIRGALVWLAFFSAPLLAWYSISWLR